MRTEDWQSWAALLAAVLFLITAPAATYAGDEWAMPAMLHLAVAHTRAADVSAAYHLDGAGRGVNPRHGLELAFTPRGAQVGGPAEGFALNLERFGRGDGRPVRRAAPHIDDAWVEYDRGAGLSEWFVNMPGGVEQGWTVARRPVGRGVLVLELDTARPPEQIGERRLAWSALVYHRLLAVDAGGRRLPSQWKLDGTRLRIEVDDREALYPVLIDPWIEQAKLSADDGEAGDQLGFSVALSGDTALVGALFADVGGNTAQGAAYVFTRSSGEWSQQAKLIAADGATGDFFGTSVALSGDTALVGVRGADVDGNSFQGAAYVFTRSGGMWSQQDKLTADDGEEFDQFGVSVALSGDTALVGADFADVGGNPSQGAAYVFTRSDGMWSQQTKLTADDGTAFEGFSKSVALAGDTALVGSRLAVVDGNLNQGAAYVFTRSGGAWSHQAKLTADDGAEDDQFGFSVTLSGDTALVGANTADVGGNGFQGAAYVFTRSGETWSQQAKLTAADGAALDEFGVSVALAGDTALVGADRADVGGNTQQGAAYVFTRSGETWSQQAKLTATDGATDDQFGWSVALASDTALVGARFADVDGNTIQGAAYVFLQAELSFNPQTLDFGDVEVDTSSNPMAVMLENTSDVEATELVFVMSGDSFEADTSACGDSLPIGGSCEVVVAFTPEEVGPATAELQVDSADGAAAVLALTGNGVEAPMPGLAFSPASLDFDEVEVGTTSPSQVTTLENTGNVDLTGIALTMPGNGFAADTLTCGDSLPAGGSCEVAVTFTPTESGPAAASVAASSTEGADASLGLAGTGFSDAYTPTALGVDPQELVSDGNGVFEPGEQVDVAPSWRNNDSQAQSLGGTASAFEGPEGAIYTLAQAVADYGLLAPGAEASCLDTEVCYALEVDDPASRPAPHWDATLVETLSDSDATPQTWTLHIGASFADVPPSHLFYRFIETVLHHGMAVDCGGGNFCPDLPETREMMAMAVLRALEGPDFEPTACMEGMEAFDDVLFDDAFCPWIEELFRRGVTVGCGGGNYCPGNPVNRNQMAVFLLKTLEGEDFEPPPCSNLFDDVACPSLFADWIEELFRRGITAGCATAPLRYCPGVSLSRGQCAAFQSKTFDLALYGP